MIVRSAVLNVSLAPTKKCCKVAKEIALKDSVLYPAFLGKEGPAEQLNPAVNNALDYFLLLWPNSLTTMIAVETNRYAQQKNSG